MKGHGRPIEASQVIVDKFGQQLSRSSERPLRQPDDSYVRPIDMDIPDGVKPPKISERCVWNTLVDVKKTATGPNNIPYWIWKDCA